MNSCLATLVLASVRRDVAPPRGVSARDACSVDLAGVVVAIARRRLECRRAGESGGSRVTAADSVFARARQLVVNGNGAAGRVLVDSDDRGDDSGHAGLRRGALLARDARGDERRRRARLPAHRRRVSAVAARRRRAASSSRSSRWRAAIVRPAITHLERFLLENPEERRARARRVACSCVSRSSRTICSTRASRFGARCARCRRQTVELRNQLDYYLAALRRTSTRREFTQPWRGLARHDAIATARRPTARIATRTPAPRAAKARFTLQVAAYGLAPMPTRSRSGSRLAASTSRVAGTARMFRVRIGHYETRAAAAAAAKELKAKKIDAFVTEIGGDDK